MRLLVLDTISSNRTGRNKTRKGQQQRQSRIHACSTRSKNLLVLGGRAVVFSSGRVHGGQGVGGWWGGGGVRSYGDHRPKTLAFAVFLPFAQHDAKRMLDASGTRHAVTSAHVFCEQALKQCYLQHPCFFAKHNAKGRLTFLDKAHSHERSRLM